MSMLQAYEQILSEYAEMVQSIQRNEEISVNLACEIQKKLLHMSQVSAQAVDLKSVYEIVQKKEEIMNDFSTENFDTVDIPKNKCNSLKETITSVSSLLQEISTEFQELVADEDETAE